MWKAIRRIIKVVVVCYVAVFLLLLGAIIMTNVMLAGLQ